MSVDAASDSALVPVTVPGAETGAGEGKDEEMGDLVVSESETSDMEEVFARRKRPGRQFTLGACFLTYDRAPSSFATAHSTRAKVYVSLRKPQGNFQG